MGGNETKVKASQSHSKNGENDKLANSKMKKELETPQNEMYFARKEAKNLPSHSKKIVEVEENGREIYENRNIPVNKKYTPHSVPIKNEPEKLLILNKIFDEQEKIKKKQMEQMLKNGEMNKIKAKQPNNSVTPIYNKNDNKKKDDDNDEQYEIPVLRRRGTDRDFSFKDFFQKKQHSTNYENNKGRVNSLFDIFNLNEFPMLLLKKRKETEKKEKDKKFVVPFLDTFNDDFVKKNINNTIIFEAIDICKGVSYLSIDKNISVNCMGMKEKAYYFYKLIPLSKIYSKEAIQKIMEKGPEPITTPNIHAQKKDANRKSGKIIKKNADPFYSKFSLFKNFFKTKRKKDGGREMETFYNDLYLMSYDNNLKSSLCLGTHIYSKERAVKKCYGISIERNVFNDDFVTEENNNVQKNLENLYFELPHNQKNIFFKPVPYAFKNKKIVDASFYKSLQNMNWENWSYLKNKEFYLDMKTDVYNFLKDVYYTVKDSVHYFDSPKDFAIQTTQKVKDINVKMKQICERSYEITQNLVLKLSKVSKAS